MAEQQVNRQGKQEGEQVLIWLHQCIKITWRGRGGQGCQYMIMVEFYGAGGHVADLADWPVTTCLSDDGRGDEARMAIL